ncbi:MAG: hypothetical protein EXX96DRAFT_626910 [Benjaminiella poitrasii]|nr:MAG: hypothetical protein EXX96DRAFT_626910 [Benjaminiella poitrasii]
MLARYKYKFKKDTRKSRILLAKFLLRFLFLPDNALFTKLLPHIRILSSRSQYTPNNFTSLSLCRPTISIDHILWLPMSFVERSRCISGRPVWLPSDYSTYCSTHPNQRLTRRHAIICFQMYKDPLSFLLNQLSTKKSTTSHSVTPWRIRWPSLCLILHEFDQLQHNKPILPTPTQS